MKKNKRKILMLSMVMAMMLSTACNSSNNANSGNDGASNKKNNSANTEQQGAKEPVDPVGKYEQTVEFSTVLGISQDPKFPEGESYDSNMFLNFVDGKLNVKQKVLWTAPTDGEQYFNKLSLSVASGDIPDMFLIDGNKRDALLKQLVDGDMIEDLTSVYEQYASTRMKEIYGALDNASLKQATFDGKLMAIPVQKDLSQTNVVWVRQDWLDEMKLPTPETIEDLRTVAKAFAEKKGMGLSLRAAPDGIVAKTGDMQRFDLVFNYFNAYPRIWVTKPDGMIEWGGIQPEVKEGLKVAAEMYANGEIDKEFAVKDNGKTAEDIGANKTGLFFQPWWAPLWPLQNSVTTDPNAKWKAYGIANNGTINASMDAPSSQYLVVRKGFKHPEALMKLVNLGNEIKDGKYPELVEARTTGVYKNATLAAKQAYFPAAEMTDHNTVVKSWDKILKVLSGENDDSTLDLEQKAIKDQIQAFDQYKDTAVPADKIGDWQQFTAWTYGLAPSLKYKENIVFDAFPGSTPTMEKKWALLEGLQSELFVKIVMGDEKLEAFDDFVAKWKSSGGDEITKEVNEASKK